MRGFQNIFPLEQAQSYACAPPAIGYAIHTLFKSPGFCFGDMIACSFDYLIYPNYSAYTMDCDQRVISGDNEGGAAICSAGLQV